MAGWLMRVNRIVRPSLISPSGSMRKAPSLFFTMALHMRMATCTWVSGQILSNVPNTSLCSLERVYAQKLVGGSGA